MVFLALVAGVIVVFPQEGPETGASQPVDDGADTGEIAETERVRVRASRRADEETIAEPAGVASLLGRVLRGTEGVPGVAISARLRPATGAWVAGLRARQALSGWEMVGEPVAATRTGADGRFRLDRLPEGEILVTARTTAGVVARETLRVGAAVPGTLELRLPITAHVITGRFLMADGSPFRGYAGAWSEAYVGSRTTWMDSGWHAVDREGRFSIPMPTRHEARLYALLPGRFQANGMRVAPGEDGTEWIVEPGAPFSAGRVLRESDDAPVPGAELLIVASQAPFTWTVLDRTDDRGRFRFPRGAFAQIVVDASGMARTVATRTEPDDAEVVIRVRAAGTLVGRVVRDADGTPVEGATVHVLHTDDPRMVQPRPTARTALDGSFSITGLAQLPISVSVQDDAWVSTVGDGSAVTVEAPGDDGVRAPVEIRVVPAASLVVSVIEEDGSAIPGTRVALLGPNDVSQVGIAWTDAAGVAVFRGLVPGREFFASVRVAGRAPTDGMSATAAVDPPGAMTVTAAPARHLTVRVTGRGDGTAIADAVVAAMHEVKPGNWVPARSVRTDAGGSADLRGLPVGALRLDVTGDGLLPEFVAVGDGTKEIAIAMSVGATVRVHLVRPDGTPAIRTSIRVDGRLAGDHTQTLFARSDDEGVALIRGLADVSYQVSGSILWEGVAAYMNAEVRPTSEGATLMFEAPNQGVPSVSVVLLGPDGNVVPRADVAIVEESRGGGSSGGVAYNGKPFDVSRSRGRTNSYVRVANARDAEGEPLPIGPHTYRIPEEGPELMRLRLPRGRVITGRVVGPDGVGVRGVTLTAKVVREARDEVLVGDDGLHAKVVTEANGGFSMISLADAEYVLTSIVPTGLTRPSETIRLRSGSSDVRIALGRSEDFVLTIVDASGQPIRGATVRVSEQPPDGTPWSGSTILTSDRHGRVALLGLAPGRIHALTVTPPRTTSDLLPAHDAEWIPASSEITLEPALALSGVVRDAVTGKPVPGARVRIPRDTGGHASVVANDEGAFVFETLAGGVTYRLKGARPGKHFPPRDAVVVEARAGDTDIEVVIDAGGHLEIHVTGIDAIPRGLMALVAERSSAGDRHVEATVDENGVAHVWGLPRETPLCVVVGPTASGKVAVAESVVSDGPAVTLTLKQGATLDVGLTVAGGGALPTTDNRSLTLWRPGWPPLRCRVNDDGSFAFLGLPAGEWHAEVNLWVVGAPDYHGEATVRAGDTSVTIEISADE